MDCKAIISEVRQLRIMGTDLRDSLRFARKNDVAEIWEQIREVDARVEFLVGQVKSHIRQTMPEQWDGKMPRAHIINCPKTLFAKIEDLYRAGEKALGWNGVLPKLNEAAYGYPVWS